MNRREFGASLLGNVTSFALIEALIRNNGFSSPIKPIVKHWAEILNEYCSDLKKEAITTTEWQFQVEQLYKKVELEEILKFIDFQRLTQGFDYPDLGVATKKVVFPKLTGLPDKTVFLKKIFGMQKDRAIIPHGHSNMASSHLILKGEMHLRNYEKIRQEEEHLIIKPSVDKIIKLGESSSISDEKNNVHWFIANTPTAFTFDVIMLDIGNKPYDIHNLDIYKKQQLSDGTMRVPILDVDTALKKYGKESHH